MDRSNCNNVKRCIGCPFNDGLTEEASMAQNLGCLPTQSEMIEWFDSKKQAISCHSNTQQACRGLSAVKDASEVPVKSYEEWFAGE